MKNFRHFTLLLTSLFMLSFASCSKDDDDDVSPNIARLTAGEWIGSAIYSNGVDVTTDIEEANNLDWSEFKTVFERNGNYTEYYGTDTIDEGVWEYENDERVIRFNSGTSNEYSVVISKLDDDELFYVQGGLELRFTRQQ